MDKTSEFFDCTSLKPYTLIIDDLKWRYLYRSVVRGKNILILGPTGCAKTLAAHSVSTALKKSEKFFSFNLGSTQDARSVLIGNTNYEAKTGTVFNESTFVKAIRTKGAIILLDELSRAHTDAWNILLPVLDELQRYLRLDEKRDCEVVKVASGVTFIATANVGAEYTATRIMDRALLNRFPIKIEMSLLDKSAEFNFLKTKFNISDPKLLHALDNLVDIACFTRKDVKRDDAILTNVLSTRETVEMAELLVDGFSFMEIVENVIYPNFDDVGGLASERVYVKQVVQKYITDPNTPTTPFAAEPTGTVPPF